MVYITPMRLDIAIFLLQQARGLTPDAGIVTEIQAEVAQSLADKAAALVTRD